MPQLQPEIQFDVLIRSTAGDVDPQYSNIENLKPEPENIEQGLRWFRQQGLTVYPTDFGFSGETTKNQFETVFKVRLIPSSGEPLSAPYIIQGQLQLPREIADLIAQLTLTRPPELFSAHP